MTRSTPLPVLAGRKIPRTLRRLTLACGLAGFWAWSGLAGMGQVGINRAWSAAPSSAPHNQTAQQAQQAGKKPAAKKNPVPTGKTPAKTPRKIRTPAEVLELRLQAAEQAVKAAHTQEASNQAWQQAESLRKRQLSAGAELLLTEAREKSTAPDLHAALYDLSAALTLQPDAALLRRTRAEMRLASNDPTGAVQDLGIALQQDPGDPTSWFLLARTEEALHNGPAALNAFRQALKNAPLFPERTTLLHQFTLDAQGQPD
ncbi:tetratricopeptide repeat protein [Oecophyllibacter saccharovorans]|uniref:hypothetical protein n=1 Tax=Oecophyllibacter saccharovorans TaxID=2558360 RepID=UPI001168FBB5|nr:hypothetical protein [Oecophyllibacter saccharovorans]TPW35178.1 hypothetical protein E3203_06870 [Oecophyllibacter saccharovorans]